MNTQMRRKIPNVKKSCWDATNSQTSREVFLREKQSQKTKLSKQIFARQKRSAKYSQNVKESFDFFVNDDSETMFDPLFSHWDNGYTLKMKHYKSGPNRTQTFVRKFKGALVEF